MVIKPSLLSLIFFSFGFVVCNGNEQELLVQISFNSLQSGSLTFFQNQLQPIFEQFTQFVLWDFIPCSTSRRIDGALVCLRGEEECNIDRIHACTSGIYRDDSISLGKFFICMMTSGDQLNAGPQCAECAGFDWGKIEGCSQTDQAVEFCNNRFEVLNKYKVELVPGIFYNKKYVRADDEASFCDLAGTICAKLSDAGVTAECC